MKQSFKCLLIPWQLSEGLGMTLVFLKPHFGALSAVLAPFFAWWCSVCTYISVTVTFACLLCLAYSIWGHNAGTRPFSVWGFFTNYRSLRFTSYVCFLLFLDFFWERAGSWSGLSWAVLAYGLFLPCMTFFEQDESHIFLLNSQMFKQVPCTSRNSLNKVMTCLRGLDQVHSC